MLFQETTGKIIQAFYAVYNERGYGFLEKVYENAMVVELRYLGIEAIQQMHVPVTYRGERVGDYYPDLFVVGPILVELKTTEVLHPTHEAQLVNCLKATGIEIGLLLNFGPEPAIKRKIRTPTRK